LFARRAKALIFFAFFSFLATAPSAAAAGIAFIGDSMSDGIWGAFIRMSAGRTCPTGFALYREAQNGTGLTRLDRFDWASHVAEISREHSPDIFVMSLGLNDRQPIVAADGGRVPMNTQAWVDAYRENVRRLYQQATANGALAFIVGIPVLRDEAANAHAQLLNAIYEDVARQTPNVGYVRPWQLAGETGFVSYGPGPRGNVVQLRASDGVHFTTAGYDLLGIYLLPVILAAMEAKGYGEAAPACFGA
jgi:hypothetical protein